MKKAEFVSPDVTATLEPVLSTEMLSKESAQIVLQVGEDVFKRIKEDVRQESAWEVCRVSSIKNENGKQVIKVHYFL